MFMGNTLSMLRTLLFDVNFLMNFLRHTPKLDGYNVVELVKLISRLPVDHELNTLRTLVTLSSGVIGDDPRQVYTQFLCRSQKPVVPYTPSFPLLPLRYKSVANEGEGYIMKFESIVYRVVKYTDVLFLASCCNNPNLLLCSFHDSSRVSLYGHTQLIVDIHVMKNKNVITCSTDSTVILWKHVNPESLVNARILKGHLKSVTGIQVFSDESHFLSYGEDDYYLFYELGPDSFEAESKPVIPIIIRVGFSPTSIILVNQNCLVSYGGDSPSKVNISDPFTDSNLTWDAHEDEDIAKLLISEDRQFLYSCHSDSFVKKWSLSTQPLHDLEPLNQVQLPDVKNHKHKLTDAIIHGGFLFTGNRNGMFCRIDLNDFSYTQSGKRKASFFKRYGDGHILSWHGKELSVWSPTTYEYDIVKFYHTGEFSNVSFLERLSQHPLIVGYGGKNINIWDPFSGYEVVRDLITTLIGNQYETVTLILGYMADEIQVKTDIATKHQNAVKGAFAWNSPGQFVSYSDDKNVILWNVDKITSNSTTTKHSDHVKGFMQHGEVTFSYSRDQQIGHWSTPDNCNGVSHESIKLLKHNAGETLQLLPLSKDDILVLTTNALFLYTISTQNQRLMKENVKQVIPLEKGFVTICNRLNELFYYGESLKMMPLNGHERVPVNIEDIGRGRILSFCTKDFIEWDLKENTSHIIFRDHSLGAPVKVIHTKHYIFAVMSVRSNCVIIEKANPSNVIVFSGENSSSFGSDVVTGACYDTERDLLVIGCVNSLVLYSVAQNTILVRMDQQQHTDRHEFLVFQRLELQPIVIRYRPESTTAYDCLDMTNMKHECLNVQLPSTKIIDIKIVEDGVLVTGNHTVEFMRFESNESLSLKIEWRLSYKNDNLFIRCSSPIVGKDQKWRYLMVGIEGGEVETFAFDSNYVKK